LSTKNSEGTTERLRALRELAMLDFDPSRPEEAGAELARLTRHAVHAEVGFTTALGHRAVSGGEVRSELPWKLEWFSASDAGPRVLLTGPAPNLDVPLVTPRESTTEYGATTALDRHLLCSPLRVDARVEGALGVWRSPESRPFDLTDEETLATLAALSSTMLMSRLREHQAERRARGLSALQQVSTVLCHTTDIEVLFDAIVRAVQSVVDCHRASLVLIDEAGQLIIRASHHQGQGTRVERGEITTSVNVRRVLESGRSFFNQNVTDQDGDSRKLIALGIRSTIVVPLISRGRVIGTLNVGSRTPAAFDQHHASLLETIAGQLAQAVDNARAYTLRKEADERELHLFHSDRLVSLGRIAAGVAHEINNPASFTLTNLHSLQTRIGELSDVLSDSVRQELDTMIVESREGLERIRDTVRDLRTFARVDASGLDLVNINDVAHAAARIVRNEARHRAGLVLDLGKLPELVGDATKLTQLVTNLLVNAVQAIDEAPGRTHRITLRTEYDEDHVVIVVDDTGPGVPEAQLGHIFESFHTTKENSGGMGLGLSLCRDVATMHHGTIVASNLQGQGARFEVRLPVNSGLTVGARARLPSASSETASVDSGPRRSVERVLIIDDEPNILRSLTRALGRFYKITTSETGADALALLEEDSAFDVVLCDLMMPGLDGAELYERLATVAPGLRRHILFCTGGALTKSTRAFIERENPRLLYKPIDIQELCAAIEVMGAAAESRRLSIAPPEEEHAEEAGAVRR